ncbi:MAG TPA: hypothetical protein VGL04_13515 [Sporichthyaceae bacterium]
MSTSNDTTGEQPPAGGVPVQFLLTVGSIGAPTGEQTFTRTVTLPGVPRKGEHVWILPDRVTLEIDSVEWVTCEIEWSTAQVVVRLDNEYDRGRPEDLDAAVLLAAGWTRRGGRSDGSDDELSR